MDPLHNIQSFQKIHINNIFLKEKKKLKKDKKTRKVELREERTAVPPHMTQKEKTNQEKTCGRLRKKLLAFYRL